MDIEIPPGLQWVSYLAGGEWPQGSENGMFRIGDHYSSTAEELVSLIPELNRVREETISVLSGQTAVAAVEQFGLLFGGEYAVGKLADGVAALGDGASGLGTEIEYSKLSIIVGLALAAAEIGWCLANAGPTFGASMGFVPGIEAATNLSIRQIVAAVLRRMATRLSEMLTRTSIKQLFHEGLKEGFKEAGQELAQGLAQEGIVQGIQAGKGHANFRPDLFRQNAIASAVGGAAGGGTAVPVSAGLGPARSRLGAAAKGFTTFFSAGVAGNVAGNVSVGGELDAMSVIAGSTTSSFGGLKGAGVRSAHEGGGSIDPETGLPRPNHTAEPPSGSLTDLGPLDDDAVLTEPRPDGASVNSNGGNGQAPSNPGGARVTTSSTGDSSSGRVNNVAARSDSSARSSTDTTEHHAAEDDITPDGEPHSSHPTSGIAEHPTHSSTTTSSVTEEPHQPSAHNGELPADHATVHTAEPSAQGPGPEVNIDPTGSQSGPSPTDTAATTHGAAVAPATPATTPTVPAAGATPTSTPVHHSSVAQPVAAAPATTHTSPSTATSAPTHAVQENVSASPTKATSTSQSEGAPVARRSESTVEGAKPTTQTDGEPTPAARAPRDHEAGSYSGESSEHTVRGAVDPDANCAHQVADALSTRYGRKFRVQAERTRSGVPARALFQAVKSGAHFSTYSEVAKTLRQLGDGSAAVLASRWAHGGGREGGHAYLAVNDGGEIYLIDASTGERLRWPPHWGQDAVGRTAVGYLDAHGDPVHRLHDGSDDLHAADVIGDVEGHPDNSANDVARVAERALAQRDPSCDANHLTNPLGSKRAAVARARDNARWWANLTDTQREALIDTYPRQIGNAEGIFAVDRDHANRSMLQRLRNIADGIQAKIDKGVRPTDNELKFLARVNRLDTALQTATADAEQAGVGGPYLLAFDPMEFGRDGRAIVAFGEDPYKADSVSWIVPGFSTTIDKLANNMRGALNHLQSTMHEIESTPEPQRQVKTASSIAWIGYDAPNDSATLRVAAPGLARAGGDILYSDICAFNAARDVWTGDGSHFSGNHIFAHSYGSTTASFAGRDQRLADHIRTVTLLGSPGAGPLRHADDFGIGRDNVFVASSSRDPVTGLGGRTPGSLGRILGRGLGIDPAMKAFGAVRITAEFPTAMNTAATVGTHKSYFQYVEQGHRPVRTESLANFGRIAAGQARDVHLELHRTVHEGPWRGPRLRTVEPAAERPLNLDHGAGPRHSGDRDGRQRWNPRWRAGGAGEAQRLAAEVSAMDVENDTDSHPVEEPAGVPPTPDDGSAAVRAVADAAVAQRVPPVHVDDLVNPFRSARKAEAWARDNASWWAGLTDEQRNAVIETYPRQIGNAEGVFATDRDGANRLMVDRYQAVADRIQAKLDQGVPPSNRDLKYLLRMNKLTTALHNAEVAAAQAGVGRPLLLAFDPLEFGRDGRAIVSFGEDPYKADSVSWYVPGLGTTLDKLDYGMNCALNTLQSTLRENPTLSASSIAWIGYDAPNDGHTWRVAGPKLARAGGEILYSDIRAFNAARDTWAGDGSHFTGNHIFGHSYGSTTTSYAGQDGRLADHVRTVTLVGSPGAGPLRHAGDFGIGEDNVFVASSSRDPVTMLGGRTADSAGRAFGRGLGTDPVMKSFGAVRITAEFPASMDRRDTTATHNAYFDFMETDGRRQWLVTPEAAIRSESLANFGRIAAGHTERLHLEPHRTVDETPRRRPTWRTIEPAAGRSLHLDDDPGGQFTHDRGDYHRFNPRWVSQADAVGPLYPRNDCAYVVADLVSGVYGRDVYLTTELSPAGVPARDLFEAIGSQAQFATYAEVADRLRQLGHGSSAVLASSWANGGVRQGGHAYVAVNVDGEIHLIDPHAGRRFGWPPHWGQDAVSHTAVGYLDSHGNPVNGLDGASTDRLAAADAVGDVLGHRDDPDFTRRQAEYRAQDPATRRVDTRYADPLADVVDSTGDEAAARQLAKDLSGVYGPYRIQLEALRFGSEVRLTGEIFDGDTRIGTIQRIFDRDRDGNLIADHAGLVIEDTQLRGKGFSKALTSELERYYVHSGVDRIEAKTHDKGAYAWARRGFTSNTDPHKLQESLNAIKNSAHRLSQHLSDEARVVLDEVVSRLEPDHPRLPELIDLADLAAPGEPGLGRKLLDGVGDVRDGTGVNVVKYMRADHPATRPEGGIRALLHRWFGWGADQHPAPGNDCAHLVVDELNTRYGRDFRIAAASSSTGVAGWALFDAVGSGSRFATYAEVAETLHRLGDGSSAVLASRWAHGDGRRGGHAYLAVNDGGQIFLVEPHTGKRSGWPPHWGQGAVDRTAVGYLDARGDAVHPLHDVPFALDAADAVGDVRGGAADPVNILGLPDYPPRSLPDAEASAVYAHGELRMRELNERLIRDGVSVQERARVLSDLRNNLRDWTRELMSNRVAADVLAARETNLTFDDLVARNEAKGLDGDAVYEAIINTATHSGYAPATLSDVETTNVYSRFEFELRDLNHHLARNGISAEERARILSGLRGDLRAWTRELMSNRAAADWLAANESNPSFEDLVARYEARGLSGDAVYDAIVDAATHSHYGAGTLSNEQTRTVYTTFELRMREVGEKLLREGAGVEERARTLYELRASIRTWTRSLMADRETADYLTANEPNPTFEDLVERQRAKGRVGDEIYEAIIASATRSRASVNQSLGIDPENPPPLPPMRGPTNND